MNKNYHKSQNNPTCCCRLAPPQTCSANPAHPGHLLSVVVGNLCYSGGTQHVPLTRRWRTKSSESSLPPQLFQRPAQRGIPTCRWTSTPKLKTAVGCTDKWRLRMWACEHLDDSCDSCTILIWFLSCHHVLHESPHEEGVKPPWHGLPQGVWSCGTLWAPANLINAYQRSVI